MARNLKTACTGRGPDGEHCCFVPGGVCEFLTFEGDLPRCRLRSGLGSWDRVHADDRYLISPVGRLFAERYPGFGCGDFPQNIRAVMNNPTAGKCCFEVTV